MGSILLVNPPAEVPRELYDTPDYPAIGIAYVAGYLKANGIAVSVIDGKLSRETLQSTIEKISNISPDILGLTAMTHEIVTSHKIAQAVKRNRPDTAVVLGGFHGSFLPDRTLNEFEAFDYVVVGEGEIAFFKLVRALENGEDVRNIPGVASREGDAIYLNGRGEVPENLDELGTPAWELFPPAKMYPIMSQRGCPFACNFCSRPYGRKVRARSAEHVLAEIKRNIDEFNCARMDFYDETFTVRKDHVEEICNAIIEAGLAGKVRFWSYVHANTIDLPTALKMKEAGFAEVGMGVESGNAEIMKRMNKGVTASKIVEASNIFKEAGLRFGAYFIIGHPHETKSTIKDSIRLATKINPDSVAFGIMTPYPGTEIWELATRGKGGYKMIATDWQNFNKQIGSAVELNGLPRKTMEQLQLQAYLTVYLRNYRFRELFQTIWINWGRIAFIFKKILTPASRNRAGSSSWLETEPATQSSKNKAPLTK